MPKGTIAHHVYILATGVEPTLWHWIELILLL